eukprot:UN0888
MLSYKVFFAEMPEKGESPSWRFGYDLVQTYRQLVSGKAVDMASSVQVAADLPLGLQTWVHYAGWYATNVSNDLQSYSAIQGDPSYNATYKLSKRYQYHCAMTIVDQDTYEACLEEQALPPIGKDPAVAPACEFEIFKGVVRMLPKAWDDITHMQVGRLLSWAELAQFAEAAEVCEYVKQRNWHKLRLLAARDYGSVGDPQLD